MILKPVFSSLILFIAAYLTGSIPFAVITGYLVQHKDIRSQGSGNAGATNVYRVLGKLPALWVFVCDFLKGFLPVFFAGNLFGLFSSGDKLNSSQLILLRILILSGIVIGHALPLWARFKGGKGVACSAGGITALFPLAAPLCMGLFLLIVKTTKYVSLASLSAAWFLVLLYAVSYFYLPVSFSWMLFFFFLAIALLITFLHRKNIHRLLLGTEARITKKF